MHEKLNNYLITNNLLCDHQFWFKKGLCSSDALAEFADLAYESINANHKFIAIQLDFSKPFNTVHYEILLEKLDHMGMCDNVNDWLKLF